MRRHTNRATCAPCAPVHALNPDATFAQQMAREIHPEVE